MEEDLTKGMESAGEPTANSVIAFPAHLSFSPLCKTGEKLTLTLPALLSDRFQVPKGHTLMQGLEAAGRSHDTPPPAQSGNSPRGSSRESCPQ